MAEVVAGAAVGAGAMILFDPERGARRCARLRDKTVGWGHRLRRSDSLVRDLSNRGRGILAELRGRLDRREVGDEILVERVRSRLGLWTSHPGAIEVHVETGLVTLSGPILQSEAQALVSQVARVRGVRGVNDRLDAHDRPGNVPALQGQPRRHGSRRVVPSEQWTPTDRLLRAAAGSAVAAYGLSRRTVLGAGVALGGAALTVRALANQPLKRITGIGAGRRAVSVQKDINVAVPVSTAYTLWSDPTAFPSFMDNVRDVRATGPRRTHWTIRGPAGLPIEWDAVITRLIPNESISWKTAPGSMMQHAGTVRFDAMPDGSTRIELKFTYNPIIGGIGHAAATLFGADARALLDAEIGRLKTYLESSQEPPLARAA